MGLLLQNFSKSVIVLQYWANETYIANNLCENRDKPQLHCNGKCHLKKELEKDTQQEKSNSNSKEKFEVMFVENVPVFESISFEEHTTKFAGYQDPIFIIPVFSIFHPPQVVVA
ncbi:hypothetical protein [Chitinophaga silvatica]|uniref:hypothetical protein n=1 Tax=Chitinophaga silvatica TaxID=2282649 RepID=UPI0011C14CC9|nr:hypothetical protein [Chitinophaga silvatica]